jgi:hypothetical protein
LRDVIFSEDDEAALKFVVPRTMSGDCVILDPGKVFVEHSSLRGYSCVRRRGETECFFIATSNLEPVK